MLRALITVSVVLILCVACSRDEPAVPPNEAKLPATIADTIYSNGKIYTVNEAQPWAVAVAVRGNQIVYVGDAEGAESFVGDSTKRIDLDGKMMLPGFVEGHIHPIAGAMTSRGLDIQTDDRNELFERIRDYAAENPDLDTIIGYGLRFNVWTEGNPTAVMLDEIESGRPVFFFAIDGHAGWANSRALEVAGIDKDTPETVPGYSFFERDADGNPTGWIVEVPAMLQVASALVELTPQYALDGLSYWMPKLSAAGITTAHDFGIVALPDEAGIQLYADLEAAGELPIRIEGVFYWNDAAVDPLPHLQRLNEQFNSGLVKVKTLKINVDGGDDKWNALYVDGYDDKPDLAVNPIIPFEVINDAVRRVDAAGFNVVCHCFGDLAVRAVLDAVEAAVEANPDRDRRHKISHATMVHPDDIVRFGELGVTYDTSGAWMTLDPLMQTVGRARHGDRVDTMFPMKAVADAGGNVSLGSDWAAAGYISEFRPLVGIRAAVTRQLPDRDDQPPLGGDKARVPLELAIRANTLGAAYGMGMDDRIGSIEVGKLADLVVLDQNLFEIDPHDIHDVKVLSTYMDGKPVYDTGGGL